jgi:hypothetical protein
MSFDKTKKNNLDMKIYVQKLASLHFKIGEEKSGIGIFYFNENFCFYSF